MIASHRYKVGERVHVVWLDEQRRQRNRPGQVISAYEIAGPWRYRVLVDHGPCVKCWPHQLRYASELPAA